MSYDENQPRNADGEWTVAGNAARKAAGLVPTYKDNAGFVSERVFAPTGSVIVVYKAKEQGIDVGIDKYAVVCSTHGTIVGTRTLSRAKASMKDADFCEICQAILNGEEIWDERYKA